MGRKPLHTGFIRLLRLSPAGVPVPASSAQTKKTKKTASSPAAENDHSEEFRVCSSVPAEMTESERSTMSTESNSSSRRRVRFGNCQVRSYSQVLGDHPCCGTGCPISLDWDYEPAEEASVDEFEMTRSGSIRSREELRLTSEERKAILIEDNKTKHGYSEQELKRACRKLERENRAQTRKGRKETKQFFSATI